MTLIDERKENERSKKYQKTIPNFFHFRLIPFFSQNYSS